MSTEKIYYEGNVGIGIKDPKQSLQVAGDISVGHLWDGGNNTAGVRIGKADGQGQWNAGSAFLQFQDSTADGVNKGTSLAIFTHEWGVGTKETVRVAANGNVGVGTNNPNNRLDVRGQLGINSTGSAHNWVQWWTDDTNDHPAQIWDNERDLRFGTWDGWSTKGNWRELVRFTASGNVGIGTTTPGHTLDVNGTINAKQILINGQPLSSVVGAPPPNPGFPGLPGFPPMPGLPPMPAAPSGSLNTLAVGTPNVHPNFTIHAHGGSGAWKGGIASGGAQAAVAMGELGGKATIGGHNGGLGGWADLILSPEGRVGIGTATPAEKLDVAGNVKIGVGPRCLMLGNGRNTDAVISTQAGGWFRINSMGDMSFWTNGQANQNDAPQVRFDPAGNIHCMGTLAQNSDLNLKEGIRPITKALDKVTGMRGVNYHWKDAKRGDREQLGLIAQEVEAVLPEVVCTDSEGNKSITYSNLTAVLIEAIKELKQEMLELRSQVAV